MRRIVVSGVTVLAVVATTVLVQVLPGGAPEARADGLVPYTDCAEYLERTRTQLQATATSYSIGDPSVGGSNRLGRAQSLALSLSSPVTSAAGGAELSADAGLDAGPTGTNLQERGVDEPDVAKFADGRIVTVNDVFLRVHTTGPSPEQVGLLSLAGEGFVSYEPIELLVVGTRVLAMQNWMVPVGRRSSTRVVLIDLSGPRPVVAESATVDGSYVSARLVDGTVRLVTRFQPVLNPVSAPDPSAAAQRRAQEENRRIAGAVTLAELLPRFVHEVGTMTQEEPAVGCSDIAHPPGRSGNGMLVVSTLRPESGLAPVDRDAVSSDGELVYASTGRLYVATHQYPAPSRPLPAYLAVPDIEPGAPFDPSPSASPSAPATRTAPPEVTTEIHAFDTTAQRATTYVASGSVPGYVHGRWAFSEHEGVLRVATTRSPNVGMPADGAAGDGVSTSMVVKLSEDGDDLVEVGRIEGLGRTEEIKSVRYLGELAAVVTFRQTDPLYLLDLGDRPRVLGELKIPGFSTYLHPIGDGLLLALGHDAGADGFVTGEQASVFDIGDPATPRLVDRFAIEGHSTAVEDSRAFTYDPSRRLLLLPIVADGAEGYRDGQVRGVRVGADGTLAPAGTVSVRGRTLGMNGNGIERVLIDGTSFYGVHHKGVLGGTLDGLMAAG